jgi:phosphatidyl-myo-inositol dimannoside synthase
VIVAHRPRLLVVTRNLPPLVGGMERLMAETIAALSTDWEVGIVGPAGCEAFLPTNAMVRAVPPAPLWKFLPYSLGHATLSALRFKPDLILSGSGLTAPVSLLAGWFDNVPVVTWLHGLDIVASNRIYQSVFVPCFRFCRLVLANSLHTAQLAQEAGVSDECIRVLNPGVRIPPEGERPKVDFRARYQIGSRPLLLSVGRLTRRKGLVEFVERCIPALVESIPDIVLAIVGEDAAAAARVSTGGSRAQISEAAERAGVLDHLIFTGSASEDELAAAYSASSLHVFPVLDLPGDVEGFGMVAAEAAAYGLPTVAFAVGGVPDAVCDGVSGWLIESGNYDAITNRIRSWILQEQTSGVSADACRAHAARLSWQRFGAQLRLILGELRRSK